MFNISQCMIHHWIDHKKEIIDGDYLHDRTSSAETIPPET